MKKKLLIIVSITLIIVLFIVGVLMLIKQKESKEAIAKNYNYYYDTDIFTCESAFGWNNPIISNDSWNNGFYYAAYANINEEEAYIEYKTYLFEKGYNLINETQDGNAKVYIYSKEKLKVSFRIQKSKFEITLEKIN